MDPFPTERELTLIPSDQSKVEIHLRRPTSLPLFGWIRRKHVQPAVFWDPFMVTALRACRSKAWRPRNAILSLGGFGRVLRGHQATSPQVWILCKTRVCIFSNGELTLKRAHCVVGPFTCTWDPLLQVLQRF